MKTDGVVRDWTFLSNPAELAAFIAAAQEVDAEEAEVVDSSDDDSSQQEDDRA